MISSESESTTPLKKEVASVPQYEAICRNKLFKALENRERYAVASISRCVCACVYGCKGGCVCVGVLMNEGSVLLLLWYNCRPFYREFTEYYEEDRGLPIFRHIPVNTKRVFTVEQIVKTLLDPKLEQSGKVCRKLPVSISHNVVFIVDVSKLDDPNDVNCDDMGVWRNNRVDTVFFHASITEREVTFVEKCCCGAEAAYQLKRVYRDHGTNPSFHKITASITGEPTTS